jgi:hypothetical protein
MATIGSGNSFLVLGIADSFFLWIPISVEEV